MNVAVNWDNNQHSTILITLQTPEAWDEIEEAYQAVYALMHSATASVDLIIDVRDAPGPGKPAAFISLMRAYLNAPSNAASCILIGASQMTRVLAQNFMHSGDWHYRIEFAETLPEARQRLVEHHTAPKPAMHKAWSFSTAS
jgi:hypothetical protein